MDDTQAFSTDDYKLIRLSAQCDRCGCAFLFCSTENARGLLLIIDFVLIRVARDSL